MVIVLTTVTFYGTHVKRAWHQNWTSLVLWYSNNGITNSPCSLVLFTFAPCILSQSHLYYFWPKSYREQRNHHGTSNLQSAVQSPFSAMIAAIYFVLALAIQQMVTTLSLDVVDERRWSDLEFCKNLPFFKFLQIRFLTEKRLIYPHVWGTWGS